MEEVEAQCGTVVALVDQAATATEETIPRDLFAPVVEWGCANPVREMARLQATSLVAIEGNHSRVPTLVALVAPLVDGARGRIAGNATKDLVAAVALPQLEGHPGGRRAFGTRNRTHPSAVLLEEEEIPLRRRAMAVVVALVAAAANAFSLESQWCTPLLD